MKKFIKTTIAIAILVPTTLAIQTAQALSPSELAAMKRDCASGGQRLGVHEDGSFACFGIASGKVLDMKPSVKARSHKIERGSPRLKRKALK